MRLKGVPRCTGVLLVLLAAAVAQAGTAPWLSVGDSGLRADLELLSAYGLAGGPITTWPVPSSQILRALSDQAKLDAAPPAVRAAAERVLAALAGPDPDQAVRPLMRLQTTNQPELIRGFDAAARDETDVQAGGAYDAGAFDARLSLGLQSHFNGDRARFSPDGSYLAARWGNLQFYGGWLDQWYGPGETSSLILSDNARPMPKIGVMRADPRPFETPWLSWLGPWQANLFIGVLDGPRVDTNTGFVGLRGAFQPMPELEIGLTLETEICGEHHDCRPLRDYFSFQNSTHHPSKTNDEAGIDFRYTHRFGLWSVAPYVQFMNEDTGPFVHAATSYLAGTVLTTPVGGDGAYLRLTVEYADSVATLNWFDFGKKAYGVAYHDYKYVDGFRYRDRTLGFSLDSDSRLFSFEARLTDDHGRRWRLVYRHADINLCPPGSLSPTCGTGINTVSARPVTVNEFEGGVQWPLGAFALGLTLRGQDARPYGSDDAYVSGEADLRYGF